MSESDFIKKTIATSGKVYSVSRLVLVSQARFFDTRVPNRRLIIYIRPLDDQAGDAGEVFLFFIRKPASFL